MELKAFLLDLARIFVGNKWARTGSALAIMGASASLGWLNQLVGYFLGIEIQQPATWVAFSVMMTGVGLLIWGYSRSAPANVENPHDLELMARFRQIISDNLLDFLRNHNFGTPWRRSRLDALAEIAEGWKGARFEFQDRDLNAALDSVKASANRLEELVAYGSWPERNNAEMQTAKTDEDYRIGTQPSTVKKIQEMNNYATALVKEIDTLERLARAKLRS